MKLELPFNETQAVYGIPIIGLKQKKVREAICGGDIFASGPPEIQPIAKMASTLTDTVSGTFELEAWPNPSKEEFYLKLNSANKLDKMEIFVYDINGRQIYHELGDANKEYHFGNTFQSGMYFVKVLQGDKSDQVRMIKY